MKDYILTLLVAAAVTYVLTPLVRRGAIRLGAVKQPRERDVHVVPVPEFGGLAMYGGLVAALLVAERIPQLQDGFANTGMVNGLLLAGGLLVLIGFIDDKWGISALAKLAGQVAAGGILVATGTQLDWLPEPGNGTFVPTPDQATFITIFVVVATINAVNFIDGLDGLAAGIVCIAAVSFFIYYYSMTKVVDISSLAAPALASAVLIGMCIGFLPHNFSPASIMMGDTGSMLLGLLLAYAPISSITSLDPAVLANRINRYPEIMPLLLPAVLLVIPYGDLLLAVVRRTRAGMSPFAADRKHLHHRLLDIGHSDRASALIMYLWAILFSGSVVWLSIDLTPRPGAANHHGSPVFVFVLITGAAAIALLLMSMPSLRWWERRPRRPAEDMVPDENTVPADDKVPADDRVPADELRAGRPHDSAAPELVPVAGDWHASSADEQQVRPAHQRGLFEPATPAHADGNGHAEPDRAGPDHARDANGWPDAERVPQRPRHDWSRDAGPRDEVEPDAPRSVVGTVPPAFSGYDDTHDAGDRLAEARRADAQPWWVTAPPGSGDGTGNGLGDS